MVDLAKCGGEKCNIKHLCYRYTAQSGLFMQAYIAPSYKDGQCINFFYNGKNQASKGRWGIMLNNDEFITKILECIDNGSEE